MPIILPIVMSLGWCSPRATLESAVKIDARSSVQLNCPENVVDVKRIFTFCGLLN